MKLATFIDRAPTYFRAGKSYHLRSGPGRGKTTVMRALPARLSAITGKRVGIVILNGALMKPTDDTGYLFPVQRDGEAHCMFTKPHWWHTDEGFPLEHYDGGGIIFVDEEDKMDVDVKKSIGEMAQSKRIGAHILPPGWVVWFAGNRRKDRSGSTKELDHLINRRCEIDIDDDLDGWTKWAETHRTYKGPEDKVGTPFHPVGIAFANHNANIVFNPEPPKEQGPFCTPRSLTECIEHLSYFADDKGRLPFDPVATKEAAGFIGHDAATQLMATIQLEYELPKLEDIVCSPNSAPVPPRADGQMLVAYSLAYRTDHHNVQAVITYLSRFPAEFAVLYARTATTRDATLLNTDTFDQWCRDNASLMQAVSTRRR